MFTFFKRSKPETANFSMLATDMHSHLLPAIDDGSPDPETSLELIRGLIHLGYKKFITTPHVMMDLYKNNSTTIAEAAGILQHQLNKEKLDVVVHPAAEYLIDENFENLLSIKEPLLTLHENYVLVEFSFVSAPLKVQEILFELQIAGYKPVLAHPERYSYLQRNREVFDDLKNAGCLFQLNLLSLTDYYGKGVTELANYLIGKDYYNLAGTDLHHNRHLAGLTNYGTAYRTILRLIDSGKLLNSTW
ncbi:MAG: hypothetical protein H7Y03_10375 [Chitinophagaceae bacterium]|nr:hypothetical protein [Chitinophagaceae bacterium]